MDSITDCLYFNCDWGCNLLQAWWSRLCSGWDTASWCSPVEDLGLLYDGSSLGPLIDSIFEYSPGFIRKGCFSLEPLEWITDHEPIFGPRLDERWCFRVIWWTSSWREVVDDRSRQSSCSSWSCSWMTDERCVCVCLPVSVETAGKPDKAGNTVCAVRLGWVYTQYTKEAAPGGEWASNEHATLR